MKKDPRITARSITWGSYVIMYFIIAFICILGIYIEFIIGIYHLIPIKIILTCLIMSSSELYTLYIFLTMLIVIARNIYPVKIKL